MRVPNTITTTIVRFLHRIHSNTTTLLWIGLLFSKVDKMHLTLHLANIVIESRLQLDD
jgi:hypothetical protein